ncbi:mannitol-1-phosphate/altronate dehydrogenase [Bradyrhizobium sp. GM0.4]
MSSSGQTRGETTCASAAPISTGCHPASAARPYDRSRVTSGIVHLGLGAFHRAHQAVVIDDCLAAGATSWGIVGASLRSPDTRDALAPQDHLYTVAVRAAEGTEHRIIGALLDSVVARESPARLVERMADPAIRIVSLTVTEKGYCHTPQTGDLDERHPDVVHDLNNFDAPRSAPGFIVAALARRRALGAPPFTVLSCEQPRRQRPHRAADRDAIRRAALEGSRQVDRGYGGLPLDHGRPDRAGDDG